MSSIANLLNQIENDEMALPAIQRDFVWSEDQTEKLLDSIMRGYPIGIVLMWETYHDIQFRRFVRDYEPGTIHRFAENPTKRRLRVVLDGQQRLQSLFIALRGSRAGKALYLDIFSGEDRDDVSEDKFNFEFYSSDDAADRNEWARGESQLERDGRHSDYPEWWLRVQDLFAMGARERRDLINQLGSTLDLSADELLRAEINLATLDEMLTRDQNILKVSTIDENLPPESPGRKSDADVLEIFVRINREGTPLSRSDLIFSMLKLNWKESSEGLPEFISEVNQGNDFKIDTDFVVRCLFVVSDLGSKLDLNLLRKKSNAQKLRANFRPCCDAIRSCVDFVQEQLGVSSAPLVGGMTSLVPFVYYFFRLPRYEVPNREMDRVRQGLYLTAFARPFSRYTDSRIGPFVRSELRSRLETGDYQFPLEAMAERVNHWERLDSVDDLAERNPLLTLHVIQRRTRTRVQYANNAPESDHIFPRAELRRKGYPESDINSVANFWIMARGKNRNKSNRHPRDYLIDVADRQLTSALIEREMLDYRRYNTFLRDRRTKMLSEITRVSGLTDALWADA